MIVTIRSNDEVIEWGVKGTDRIVQNARNILRTRVFEVPFMRDLGISPDFIDSSHKKTRYDIFNAVKAALKAHEPRVKVLNVQVESVDDNGEFIISVELEV